jgi:hypothetical protein
MMSASRNAATISHNATQSKDIVSHHIQHTSTFILNAKYSIHLVDLSCNSSWLQNGRLGNNDNIVAALKLCRSVQSSTHWNAAD